MLNKTLPLNKYVVLFVWAIFLTTSFYMFTAFLGLDMLHNPFTQASSCGLFGYRSNIFCDVESISYIKILIWFSYGLIAVTVSYSILKAKTRILWFIFIGIALILSLLFVLSGPSVNTRFRWTDYRPLID